ncbi:MAG: pyridoxamine 5'-phosphate oxidase family protein [Clostridia bacterium]|nr:pyridoxamine 5'-phosphate oxidase family protein [Clostridia bacterium]
MAVPLTPRMKDWLETLGAHIATATRSGFPTVTVVDRAIVDGGKVTFILSSAQAEQIRGNLEENPRVAIGPGGLGVVRAPYQFKGNGHLEGDRLVVEVDKIYCTRPGPEAGLRLDVLGYEKMREFDESRWTDMAPKPN